MTAAELEKVLERDPGDPFVAVPPQSDTAELYDRIASSYMRWWAPVIAPAALRLLDLVDEVVVARPRAVLIDVGAGTGTLTRGAVARWPGVRAIAVDASDGMLDVGRAEAGRTLRPSGLRRIRWMRGVAERLPLPDQSADARRSEVAPGGARRSCETAGHRPTR
jgi:ubiquinone/menaquinone biosynthesis C-methylase UbiE